MVEKKDGGRETWSASDLAIIKDRVSQKWGRKKIYAMDGKRKGWNAESIKRLLRRVRGNGGSWGRKAGQGRQISAARKKLRKTLE